MNTKISLLKRCDDKCELCSSQSALNVYNVPPNVNEISLNNSIMICENCRQFILNPGDNANHWRCLNESMWSEYPPVQVVVWRLLKQLSHLDWARDLSDQLFLEEDVEKWAKDTLKESETENIPPTKDSNGSILLDGDSVTLIKDLEVKGANFTAKRGTLVKNISLTSNPLHIEGRVNGTQIVLLTCFLKKAL